MKLGLALVRLIVGALFFGHGTQKLFGWFGGHGPDGTGQFFEGSLGLAPGKRNALTAGAAEAGGGALLAAGLFTPLAAATLTGAMATAIKTAHLDKGPWVSDGGYEYNLVLMAIVFAVTDTGPGGWSLDAAFGKERSGPGWAIAELLAGLGGSAAILAAAQRATDASSTSPAEAEAAPTAGS